MAVPNEWWRTGTRADQDAEAEASAVGRLAAAWVASSGVGGAAPPDLLSAFGRTLGHDVRGAAVSRSREPEALGARGVSHGAHVVLDPALDLTEPAGLRTLGHELVHYVQKGLAPATGRASAAGPIRQRVHRDTLQCDLPTESPDPTPPELPEVVLQDPGPDDIITVHTAGGLVALPARGNFVALVPISEGRSPESALVTLPTVGKEGLMAVRVRGRTGFLVDMGGTRGVVFPGAVSAIQHALNIDSISGGVVTHIHDDHVRSLVQLVIRLGIRPERLTFPSAFAVNPEAPSSRFAQALQELQTLPAGRALGHGPTANYASIREPSTGQYFREVRVEGEWRFEYFGLTQSFRELREQRSRGEEQPRADTASLLTRMHHVPSGLTWARLSDLRGSDLTLLRTAMGDAEYDRLLRNVTYVEGFQHHMGALETRADREGLVDFLTRTQLRHGGLTVVVQSSEQYGGRQFLNRSLITALTSLGVDVHVVGEAEGESVGSLTVSSEGNVTRRGSARQIESFAGSESMQAQVRRLSRLREAELATQRYSRFLDVGSRHNDAIREARETLETNLTSLTETTLANVARGAQGRASGALLDPAAVEARRQAVYASRPIEDLLTPANMETLRELNRIGPHLETWERERAEARRTGRMSTEGIDALWETNPRLARRLVGSSGLGAREQRRILESIPGQPRAGAVSGRGAVAGFLIVVEVANQLGPLVQGMQAASFDSNVRRFLEVIAWWQDKGVSPQMVGVDDNWAPFYDNEWTRSPARIRTLLGERELSYLALTDIADSQFDFFIVWAQEHLLNYRDWRYFLGETDAVRFENGRWEYLAGDIEETWYGFDIPEEWRFNEVLDHTLNEAWRRIRETSETQIASRITEAGSRHGVQVVSNADAYHSAGIFETLPAAMGVYRFKAGERDDPTLYTLAEQRSRDGYDADIRLYRFPASASPVRVPEGYWVVGGADFQSYAQIYRTPNLVERVMATRYGDQTIVSRLSPNTEELLLADPDDLERAP